LPASENLASELLIQNLDSISPVADELNKGVLVGTDKAKGPQKL
jgi:hypothetical protein